jgi:hypothetical protein
MDQGFAKAQSLIKTLTGFDPKCGDLGDIYPFRQGWKDG